MIRSFEAIMQITRGVSSAPALEDDAARGLYDAAATVPHGGIVVEVGCQLGRSSSILAQLGQDIGFHTLHIDPYTQQMDMAMQWVEMMGKVGVTFLLAHMRTDEAEWLLSRLGPLDLAYIDGDHNLPGVRIDLALVAERIRAGGLLCAHDYGHGSLPGVTAALNEYIDGPRSPRWDRIALAGTLGVWRRR